MKEVTLSKIIGENGVFVDGDWVESKDQDANGDVRLIQLADIGDGVFINKSNRFLTSEKAKELKCTLLKQGDLLIARMPDPLGRACIFPGLNMPCITVVDICIVRPDANIADHNWLKFLINSYDFRNKINRYITGTTRQRISRGNLEKLSFHLPQISFQLNIAKLLTKAENLIAKRKESIRLLDEYLKSTFLEMFGDPVRNENGWEIKILGNICGVGSSKRVFVEELVVRGIPFYRGTEIGQMAEGQEITPSLFITEEHYNQLRKHTGVPKTGDLLMPSICSDGRIFRVINNQPFYFKDGRVLWIKVNESKINSIYLQSVLKVIFRTNYDNIASGTTFAELKIVALKQIKIPVAPYALQTQFAQIIEKTETLKAQYKKGLQEMENLYGSLSQRAFRGELGFKEEGLMVALEPEVTYSQICSKIPEKSRGFAKQVLSAKIISILRDRDHFTHIKLQKLQYLAEHYIEEDLNWNYYRLTAGPYDNKYMHALSARLKQNKWFEEKQFRFYPLGKVEEIDRYYESYFGNKKEKLSKLFSLLINSSERLCEAVATIYAVWNNHIILKQEFSRERIKQDFFEWSKRKTNLFSESDFDKTLAWMQKHAIVPIGFGQLIKERK